MHQFLEFFNNHPYLFAALAVAVALLVANEALRLWRGDKRLAPSEAVRMINERDAVVLDVRAAGDFKKGHILNAVHMPVGSIDDKAKELEKYKQRPVLCYCGIGTAAPQAVDKLKQQGFEDVHALKGGLNAWQSANLPVTTK